MEKPPIDEKEMILGVLFILGGLVNVAILAATLRDRYLISLLVLCLLFAMLGTSYIFTATEGLRKNRREKHKTRDTKGLS
jgi:hypothetical protein